MSPSGRKQSSHGSASPHHGGSRFRHGAGGKPPEADSRKQGRKKATGLRGKVAAFIRGSLEALAKGHRATLGRMLKRKPDEAAAAHSRSHKSTSGHRAAAPARSAAGPRPAKHPAAHKAQPAGHTAPPADCRWIDTEELLQQLVEEIRAAVEDRGITRSYIDTEADSLHHYTEKLCLIQLAVDGRFALIDTLALTDLSGLLALLDRTELWLHGADYDLTLLKRTYNWSPRRICDTQIAARLCGHRPFGLAALVERHCGIVLCKASQKADWSQRPLPAKMQAYAVDDVRYLAQLAGILTAELAAKGRTAWFEQSCANLRSDVLKRPDRDREDAWRISGCGRLKPPGLAMLRELWLWRDAMAAARDVPPFKILNNQQLLAMATDYEARGRVDHPPRWRPAWRDGLHAAVERVRSADPAAWPQQPKVRRRHITEAQKNRIEKLCADRDRKAEALGIESSLLGSRATLEAVVLQPPEETGTILMPWQCEVLGQG